MESIQGIVIGAEVLGHLELPSNGAIEHPTERDTRDLLVDLQGTLEIFSSRGSAVRVTSPPQFFL